MCEQLRPTIWELRLPLPHYIDTHIGRSPHVCEDCGHGWIYGPFAWCMMHLCANAAGVKGERRMAYTDHLRAAIDLDDLRDIMFPHLAPERTVRPERPVLTVVETPPEPSREGESAFSAAS